MARAHVLLAAAAAAAFASARARWPARFLSHARVRSLAFARSLARCSIFVAVAAVVVVAAAAERRRLFASAASAEPPLAGDARRDSKRRNRRSRTRLWQPARAGNRVARHRRHRRFFISDIFTCFSIADTRAGCLSSQAPIASRLPTRTRARGTISQPPSTGDDRC